MSGQTYYEGWGWEWSANDGSGWTTISGAGANPPTYEYSPTATDVGRYIRARMKLTDRSFAYTRTLGGPVVAESATTAGGPITFTGGHAAPKVGTRVVASDILPLARWMCAPAGSAARTTQRPIPTA